VRVFFFFFFFEKRKKKKNVDTPPPPPLPPPGRRHRFADSLPLQSLEQRADTKKRKKKKKKEREGRWGNVSARDGVAHSRPATWLDGKGKKKPPLAVTRGDARPQPR
jgi:hypothetical protein